jgi:hypothetical protein
MFVLPLYAVMAGYRVNSTFLYLIFFNYTYSAFLWEIRRQLDDTLVELLSAVEMFF